MEASRTAPQSYLFAKPCCQGMALLFENQGRSGFSARVETFSGVSPYVTIQFSSVDEKDSEEALERLRAAPGPRVRLASWLAIRRCPWCGYSVRKMLFGTEKSFLRKILDRIRWHLD